jgi:hypothetical protein
LGGTLLRQAIQMNPIAVSGVMSGHRVSGQW